MIRVGIVGGTGYTGVELLRSLLKHPQVNVEIITSRGEEGVRVADLYPSLRAATDLTFTRPDVELLGQCNVVFFATPHTVAMEMMPELIAQGTRVVDLSADFRLKDAQLWEKWYGEPHSCPDLLVDAVYGLPEVNRESIRTAQLVAAPGCYPTAVQLGFIPLLENRLIKSNQLIANAASGVSGAGRQAKIDSLFAEVSDSYKAYAVPGHRHLPEIEQGLSIAAGETVQMTFAPHLVPMVRGIHATLYGQLTAHVSLEELQALYQKRYQNEPFVDVLPPGSHPQTRSVRGANVCRIAVHKPQGRDVVVILSVIDNLVKGASGQAIQAMNIMFGLDETTGLDHLGLMP